MQQEVASAVGVPIGPLVIYCKSAHIYEPDYDVMCRLSAVPGKLPAGSLAARQG